MVIILFSLAVLMIIHAVKMVCLILCQPLAKWQEVGSKRLKEQRNICVDRGLEEVWAVIRKGL